MRAGWAEVFNTQIASWLSIPVPPRGKNPSGINQTQAPSASDWIGNG